MFQKSPYQTEAIQTVREAASRLQLSTLSELFASNGQQRFEQFSLQAGPLFLDYSKNHIDHKALEALTALARELEVAQALEAQFKGEQVNQTEERAALHTALRDPEGSALSDSAVTQSVQAGLEQLRQFSAQIHTGQWTGYTGKPIRDVVHIGIGGSHLGPEMVASALEPYRQPGIQVHFVANVEGTALQQTLTELDPETTLFLIASKSFTTQETLTNAHSAREWFFRNGGTADAIQQHFVAISTNVEAAQEFGIAAQQVYPFADWVGGRFSVWSTVGLPVVALVGFDSFRQFLEGARIMDQHTRQASFEANMPAVLALLSFWYRQFWQATAEAILPYDALLAQLPAHLQQLMMESNGKQVDRQGQMVSYPTQPLIFGGAGTNVQHSFFQLLHQGTQLIPCDFLAPVRPAYEVAGHHQKLMANVFAQPEALMHGKGYEEVVREMRESGADEATIEQQAPFRVFTGNRPSNTLLYEKLTPYTLGSLVALYEHKTAILGYLYNINSFDQWGVELGKSLAKQILPELQQSAGTQQHDASTNGLINTYKRWRGL
jgi:glucose-6-phosphate isomerase